MSSEGSRLSASAKRRIVEKRGSTLTRSTWTICQGERSTSVAGVLEDLAGRIISIRHVGTPACREGRSSVDNPESLNSIAVVFISNMQALRVFHEQIGPMADEHDRKVAREFAENLSGIFPSVDRVQLTQEGLQLTIRKPEEGSSSEVSDQQSEPSKDGEAGEDNGNNEQRKIPLEELPEELKEVLRLLEQEDTMRSLQKTMSATAKQSPRQGALLRRGALTTLVSSFDGLIADLIRLFYRRNPGAIPEDNRALSLAKLRELKSVEDAENYLIFKEVDAVLWGSLQSQLEYLTKRLKVDLSPLDNERESLIEIFQRRNVLIHNGGIANRQYSENVSRALIEKYSVQEGEEIDVGEDYLSDALDTAYVAGVALVQQCWRKWDKADEESIGRADKLIVNQLYDSLLERRFELTTRLARYAKGTNFRTDVRRRMAVINHAIALKRLGRQEDLEAALEGDWSSCASQFRLALHALKDEEDQFYDLLPGAAAAGEVEKGDLEDWPLFEHLRGTERYEEALSGCFPDNNSDRSDDEGAAD